MCIIQSVWHHAEAVKVLYWMVSLLVSVKQVTDRGVIDIREITSWLCCIIADTEQGAEKHHRGE